MSFPSVSPPPCYGREYDNDAPRCLACGFNSSCRQEVIRVSQYQPPFQPYPTQQPQQWTPAPPPPPQFVQPAQIQPAPQFRAPTWPQPAPAAQPFRPVAPPPPPQTGYPQMAPQQQWAPVHFTVPPNLEQSSIGYYGYYPDQMWNALASVQPVWRPQQPGETFLARAGKNMLLVFMEKAAEQLLIMARQAFLPPHVRPPPEQPPIDVTPR